MYHRFFGFKEDPFNVSPDPRFMFMTDTLRETLSVLSYGITSHKGFILLTGGVGTGKTTILNVLLEWLRVNSVATAFIFNPRLGPEDFLEYMMRDLGIAATPGGKGRNLFRLNEWLLDRYEAGQTVVLVVDEAQQLPMEMLEELRLLTNLETPTRKLLQIVLAGQPELEEIVRRPSLRQLRQRITLRCRTAPFSESQTAAYMRQRLRMAGGGEGIFSPEAIAATHRISGGIARVINLLANQSLVAAYAEGVRVIPPEMVMLAAEELELCEPESAAAMPPVCEGAGKTIARGEE